MPQTELQAACHGTTQYFSLFIIRGLGIEQPMNKMWNWCYMCRKNPQSSCHSNKENL